MSFLKSKNWNFKQTTKSIKEISTKLKHLFPIARWLARKTPKRNNLFLMIHLHMNGKWWMLSFTHSAFMFLGGPRFLLRFTCVHDAVVLSTDFMGKWISFESPKLNYFQIAFLDLVTLGFSVVLWYWYGVNSKAFGKERKYKQESNKKQTLNGDKTQAWRSILATCGVRINYDKVIKEAFDCFVTTHSDCLVFRFSKMSLPFPTTLWWWFISGTIK